MTTSEQAVIDYAVSVMTSGHLMTGLVLHYLDGEPATEPWPAAMVAELQRRGVLAR